MRGSMTGFARCHWALAAWRGSVAQAPTTDPLQGQSAAVEKLWRQFFADPSRWWDRRSGKSNFREPDFQHKETRISLWIDNKFNPPWVQGRLAAAIRGRAVEAEVNVFAWNAKLSRYVRARQFQKTIAIFKQMAQRRMNLTSYSFVPVLNACSNLGALEEGRRVHDLAISSGCELDVHVANALIDMYAKCESLADAWGVFRRMPSRDVVSWNVMIIAYVRHGQGWMALDAFYQMQADKELKPDGVTFVGAVNACASVVALEEGKHIHQQIIESDNESDPFILSSLVDMYTKCGSLNDARRVFSRMHTHDVVSWNAMIHGYVRCGQGQTALELYENMQAAGVDPNQSTFVGVIKACGSASSFEEGRRIHDVILQRGLGTDLLLSSALVDMYAKCGSIDDAQSVYEKLPEKNVVACTAMLGAYGMHGHAVQALHLFERMCQEGVGVNEVTFTCLLAACSHVGLVNEGLHYFMSMSPVYGVSAKAEHYSCVVDLLGRAGRLEEAYDLIGGMPCDATASVWMSLLAACKVHDKLEMGERIAEEVLRLEPDLDAGYVLLSNIYSAAGKWEESAKIQQERLRRGIKKEPGRSWINVDNALHSFIANDQRHPRIKEIHLELERINSRMKEAGYERDTRFALKTFAAGEKVFHLSHHSEKLAIAFGLISTRAGVPLRIFKNLRICGDCHHAIKFISSLESREIIVRDCNRFHHFADGCCSCGDYW